MKEINEIKKDMIELVEKKLKQNGFDYTVLIDNNRDKLEILVKCKDNFDIECAGNCVNSVLQNWYKRTGVLYVNRDLVIDKTYEAKIFKYNNK